jgi:hypothetical protein
MKHSAFGSKLAYLSTAPSTFTDIPNLGDFELPLGEVDIHDATSHDSPGGYEEVVPGVKRRGEITIPIQFDPANAVHKWLVENNGTTKNFRATGPTSAGVFTATFDAIIQSANLSMPVNGVWGGSFSLKVTGNYTFAWPS